MSDLSVACHCPDTRSVRAVAAMAVINGADSLAAIIKAWKMSFWPIMRVSVVGALPGSASLTPDCT